MGISYVKLLLDSVCLVCDSSGSPVDRILLRKKLYIGSPKFSDPSKTFSLFRILGRSKSPNGNNVH